MNASAERFELSIGRRLAAPLEMVWRAWSEPAELEKWFCPKPWTTEIVKFELIPGGAFNTILRGPDGEEHKNAGSFLSIKPQEQIVFTSTLKEGWQPIAEVGLPMTAIISMSGDGTGTDYRAQVLHADAGGMKTHEEMGFHEGWGICIGQLETVALQLEHREP